ncbi:MAG: nucleotidyltransferase domain-containing protein [Solirubrobacteraceae bacterium]|jgi:hypothetical protein
MITEHEIWLYGSRARGSADEASDTDVLVVGCPATAPDISAVYYYPRVCISSYDWTEIEAMWSYGSLFLHHLKTEAIRLDSDPSEHGRLAELLNRLPPFTRARHDLMTFRQAATEARRSLDDHGWPDLELHVMATVVRHAAILGAYCVGMPDYGRETPFATIRPHLRYSGQQIDRLARLATEFRYLPLGDPRWEKRTRVGLDWLTDVETFLEDLGPLIDGYEALLRTTS